LFKVLNVSLGSSERDFINQLEVLGSEFLVSRVGTDGSLEKAKALIRKNDGEVDVLTLGGVNLNYCLRDRKYPLKEGHQLTTVAKRTPVVDGEYTKAVLDIETLNYLQVRGILSCKNKNVLFMSVLDRYYLAEAFEEAGAKLVIGDALFALKLPIPFRSLQRFTRIGQFTLPLLRHIPLRLLYPLGKMQEQNIPRFEKYFNEAEIIAGDYHFIHRNMPEDLKGKTVITSTVTADDIRLLESRGVSLLVTTSPNFNGRSYGSNVLEGILYCLINKEGNKINLQSVQKMAAQVAWKPRIEYLNTKDSNIQM